MWNWFGSQDRPAVHLEVRFKLLVYRIKMFTVAKQDHQLLWEASLSLATRTPHRTY